MLHLNELRIGSWILEDGKQVKVHAIVNGGTPYCRINELIASKADLYEMFEPIPITIEILKMLGFQRSNTDNASIIHVSANDNLKYSHSDRSFSYNGKALPNSPVFVHQLQNLYLGLFQKEWDINL